ncbi:hypothetical protein BLS_000416 [Venturia inaequalis]|uniref:BRCT domain-containing protein n=1 Tax=Venturia inaequalis TaxID=5025 RepID=A0A8H3YJ72_VENIN|nr:hypothetical protein BLS_000416 [Venturia inaequalis]RDI76639.1 hypothetical protein Vi05172_g13421 [Venturia inaequalis]
MKNPFNGFTIASTGDFGKQRTAEAIKRWVENNGGRYVTKVDENVTHLVCSAECWKSQSAMVQAAKRYPKKIKIVTYDWLEDSLMSQARKREGEYLIKKHVKADRKRKNAAKGEERSALKKEVRLFNLGCEAALTDINSGTSQKKPTFVQSSLALLQKHEEEYKAKKYASKPSVENYSNYYKPQEEGDGLIAGACKAKPSDDDDDNADESTNSPDSDTESPSPTPDPSSSKFKSQPPESFKPPEPVIKTVVAKTNITIPEPEHHHIYTDLQGYAYNITLVRIHLSNNSNERYILRLYQSNSIPYTYALHQRYVKFKAAAEERVLVPIGSEWEQCYKEFKNVFKEYTGIEWEERGVEVPAEKRDRTKFVFVRPRVAGGEPGRLGQGARNVIVQGAVCR